MNRCQTDLLQCSKSAYAYSHRLRIYEDTFIPMTRDERVKERLIGFKDCQLWISEHFTLRPHEPGYKYDWTGALKAELKARSTEQPVPFTTTKPTPSVTTTRSTTSTLTLANSNPTTSSPSFPDPDQEAAMVGVLPQLSISNDSIIKNCSLIHHDCPNGCHHPATVIIVGAVSGMVALLWVSTIIYLLLDRKKLLLLTSNYQRLHSEQGMNMSDMGGPRRPIDKRSLLPDGVFPDPPGMGPPRPGPSRPSTKGKGKGKRSSQTRPPPEEDSD